MVFFKLQLVLYLEGLRSERQLMRLADAHFEKATTLEEIQERHAAFIELFNTTPHWAHREDGLRGPAHGIGELPHIR